MATYLEITDYNGYTEPPQHVVIPGSSPYIFDGASNEEGPADVVHTYDPIVVEQDPVPWDPSYDKAFPPKDGSMRMTPYARGKTTTLDFIVSRPVRYRHWYWHAKYNSSDCLYFNPVVRDGGWTENFSFERLSNLAIPIHRSRDLTYDFRMEQAIQATQADAVSDANSALDVTTEIAEAGETLTTFADLLKAPVNLIKRLRDEDPVTFDRGRSKNIEQLNRMAKPFQKLASAWLLLQYGILPVVYSIKTLNDEIEDSGFKYASERSTQIVNRVVNSPVLFAPDRYIYATTTGSTRVTSTVRSQYPRGRLSRLLDRTSFNLFSTAWELIPLSFVVDWFVNVGDTIRSTTSLDTSGARVACTAVKDESTERFYYVDRSSDERTLILPETPCYDSEVLDWSFTRDVFSLVRQVEVSSYRRFLFNRPSMVPSFNPSLSWQRVLTGVALSLNPTLRILRKELRGSKPRKRA